MVSRMDSRAFEAVARRVDIDASAGRWARVLPLIPTLHP
jgi:hypothetical protein